jgi:hypothetical protein
MKKYIQPKIRSVKLDPKQAMLQVCKAGGFYLGSTNTTNIDCSTGYFGGGAFCVVTPKGGVGIAVTMDGDPPYCDQSQALPS